MAIRDNIGLTQDLIKRLTSYYGLALRSNTDVEDMKKAVMATFHNVSSTDADPHQELCPSGARSWCRHRAAEAEGKPQLPHTYNLPNKVVEALRPVYQRLSDPQLQARCSGNKTQNAAESLHSTCQDIPPGYEVVPLVEALNGPVVGSAPVAAMHLTVGLPPEAATPEGPAAKPRRSGR
ncbi:hypothetical protein HPB52_006589 [Rhipicephalus sanguineus]|uniref:Uncharacterized protein n=1 Tax=Rhipicephalus sanguineus TaxID=34632 RepID=A0A9D4SQC7_RHISA|nr:hypothetical protein HPB52_006589 [Rhipicephalus sanguineus]